MNESEKATKKHRIINDANEEGQEIKVNSIEL